MTTVRLKGLSIYQRRGKWYVYIRGNGKALVKGFAGTREELKKHLALPHMASLYGELSELPKTKGFGTLGGLFNFYKTKDRWKNLAPRTQADYQKVIDWLDERKKLGTPVIRIRPADMMIMRDKAAEDRYPKFSNDALALLSAAFTIGKLYAYANLTSNPCEGIPRLHKNSKTANRRWTEAEYQQVCPIAPPHLRTVLALAKYAGPRGQDIVILRWDNITENGDSVRFLEYTTLKNKVDVCVCISDELWRVLSQQDKTTLTICKNSKGRPYPSENAMRKAWQDFKATDRFKKACPTGQDLTLHGLRGTFASELRERGLSNQEIARMLGDKTERMGEHYSRGADARIFAMQMEAKR